MPVSSHKYLIVVGGPTASGKTGLAIQLAQHLSVPVLSADSRQFYQEMRIGTARPTSEELAQAEHFFIADRSVEQPLSAGEYAREALAWLDNHYRKADIAIVVGGSGLFLRALTEGLDRFPAVSETIRDGVDQLFQKEGLAGLQQAVAQADPIYFAEVDQQNPARLRRALEVCRAGDHPYSFYRQQHATKRPFIPIYLQPTWPREVLYQRIDLRVEMMLAEGLEREVRQLTSYRDLAALQTVGYQEWFPYFAGEYDLATVVELIQRNTRRYAKRQLTWLRRDGYWKHIYHADVRAALPYIQLVQLQGMHIQVLRKEELAGWEKANAKAARPGWERQVITMQELTDQSIKAFVEVLSSKKGHVVAQRDWSNLNHLARSILLHEACHVLETETVYACVTTEEKVFFTAQGWQPAPAPDFADEPLAPSPCWMIWQRSEQVF